MECKTLHPFFICSAQVSLGEINLKTTRNLLVVFVLAISGCALGVAKGSLEELRAEVTQLQEDPKVLRYAAPELKQTEDALINAVNAWNSGQRSRSEEYAEEARQKIQLTKQVVEREAALGLSDEAWEQRRWLREIRERRLNQTN